MKKPPRSIFQRGLSLQLLVLTVVPLGVLLTIIAVASVLLHERAMLAGATMNAQPASAAALMITLVAPLALIAPLLVALVGLWFGARQIVRPLQRLESKAAAVAQGDYEAIQQSVGGIAEVQDLQDELSDMARKVQASQTALRDYIGAITMAQEEERLRIARELHDDTIQELIALKQRVQLAEKAVQDPQSADLFAELERLAEGTIENVRRLTRALRPIYLEDLGLVTALEMLARETSRPDGLAVDFEKAGEERRLPREAELALYRIAQHALTNVVHHGKAQRASLEITFADGETRLEVSDDGVGFLNPRTLTDFAARGHFGLLGMRERADLIGATLEVQSEPGRGTRLSVRVPATLLPKDTRSSQPTPT